MKISKNSVNGFIRLFRSLPYKSTTDTFSYCVTTVDTFSRCISTTDTLIVLCMSTDTFSCCVSTSIIYFDVMLLLSIVSFCM